jgi:integrase
MPRLLHRLSAVQVKVLKEAGYYADGGNLYLQVTKAPPVQPAQSYGTSRARTSPARTRRVKPETVHVPTPVAGAASLAGQDAVRQRGKGAGAAKSWIFRFALAGKTRDMGLGRYPTVSLDRARELAERYRRLVAEGRDPIKVRDEERKALAAAHAKGRTFEQCAKAYIAAHEASWVNAKHRQQWTNTLKSYAYPLLGKVQVAAIDTDLVMQVLQPLWAKKPETASRLRGRIETILDWAKVSGFRQGENPARWRGHLDHLLPSKRKVRAVKHHPAVPFKDIPTFMTKLQERDGVAQRALEFGILTALRSQEFRRARWTEIDTEERLWTVPGGRTGRMKRKNKDEAKDHRVPLSAAALALLKALPRVGDYVFPGQRKGDAISDTAIRDALRDMGYAHDDGTIHGFRSSFRDWAAERTNFANHVVEAALAHEIGNDVEAAYRRGELLAKRRQLMEAWAGYCTSKAAAAKVLAFEQRRKA